MIVHVALYKWKVGTNQEQILKVLKKVQELKNKINGITDIFVGENYHKESKGFTHGIVVIANNKKTLDAYRKHPKHIIVALEIEKSKKTDWDLILRICKGIVSAFEIKATVVYNTSMQKGKNFFPVFFVFLAITLFIFLLSGAGLLNGLRGFFEGATVPLQASMYGKTHKNTDSPDLKKLKDENLKLVTSLALQKEQEREIQALRDQFKTSNPPARSLLPSLIIGQTADKLIIDKGQADGVKAGDTVVYKDNLIGRISKATPRLGVVELITSKNTSFTAKVTNSNSEGVIRGGENGLILENVVLSDKINKDDLVVTKGNIDEDGSGFPPDLVIGKIVSVNKKASNLFQSAEVESLVDSSNLKWYL